MYLKLRIKKNKLTNYMCISGVQLEIFRARHQVLSNYDNVCSNNNVK